jgi:hypothetical protein
MATVTLTDKIKMEKKLLKYDVRSTYFHKFSSFFQDIKIYSVLHVMIMYFKEEGVYCFALVGLSVRRPNGFRVITIERLGLGTSNLVW